MRLLRSAGLWVTLLPAALAGQSKGRPIQIDDYYRVKTIGAPQLSPDGKWVAFTLSTRTEATNADSTSVWLVPADGSAPERRVSPAGDNASDLSWRADGRLGFVTRGALFQLDPA